MEASIDPQPRICGSNMELTGLMVIEFRREQTMSAMLGASHWRRRRFGGTNPLDESSIITRPMRRSGA
jgi:hypothetical protein